MDFTNYQVNKYRNYGGANGSKIGIIINGETYMLKFPPHPTKNNQISYTNSCFSEYISCHIADELGFNVQQTELGTYGDKIVVACKDFREKGNRFDDFASLKNSVINSMTNGQDTTLTEVLFTIENQTLINPNELKEFFWDMFILDAYLGNFDRHNGNWGFLVNEEKDISRIAPIFDCGSCLYPQNTDENFSAIMNDKTMIEHRIYSFPKSALRNHKTNINYYTFLTTTDNQDCLKALKKIFGRINENKINNIIDNTPYITDTHKKFLKFMLHERYEKILFKALQINQNIKNENDGYLE